MPDGMQTNSTAPNRLASHWHAGGWFGSQLGGTAWLFIGALVVVFESPASAAVLLGCGLASNLVGFVLWSQRTRLNPYRALQILTVVVVLAGAVATRWLELRGEFHLLDPRVGPHTMYGLLLALLFILLALFESKHRAASKVAAA
jgi:hypothetical protein